MTPTTHVEVFADVVCPFAHVGLTRFLARRDASAPDLGLRVRAWPLELVNGQPLDAETVAAKVAALRRTVGGGLFTGFDPATWPRTSLPALDLIAYAGDQDVVLGELASRVMRDALFERGEDISDAGVLSALASRIGVAVPSPEARRLVHADWQRGRSLGVKGSPHFFVDDADFFCPALRIEHVGEELAIADDAIRFDAFFRHCRDRAA